MDMRVCVDDTRWGMFGLKIPVGASAILIQSDRLARVLKLELAASGH
jgi:hypothetical protein